MNLNGDIGPKYECIYVCTYVYAYVYTLQHTDTSPDRLEIIKLETIAKVVNLRLSYVTLYFPAQNSDGNAENSEI